MIKEIRTEQEPRQSAIKASQSAMKPLLVRCEDAALSVERLRNQSRCVWVFTFAWVNPAQGEWLWRSLLEPWHKNVNAETKRKKKNEYELKLLPVHEAQGV